MKETVGLGRLLVLNKFRTHSKISITTRCVVTLVTFISKPHARISEASRVETNCYFNCMRGLRALLESWDAGSDQVGDHILEDVKGK